MLRACAPTNARCTCGLRIAERFGKTEHGGNWLSCWQHEYHLFAMRWITIPNCTKPFKALCPSPRQLPVLLRAQEQAVAICESLTH